MSITLNVYTTMKKVTTSKEYLQTCFVSWHAFSPAEYELVFMLFRCQSHLLDYLCQTGLAP